MNTMKEVKIIQSKTEPNKNHLWLSDEGLKQFKGNGWEQVLSNDNEGSGGGSNIIYKDISQIDMSYVNNEPYSIIIFCGMLIKKEEKGAVTILPGGSMFLFGGGIAMCFNLDLEVAGKFIESDTESRILTVRDLFNLTPGAKSVFDSLPTITKEQFYDLNE